MSTACCPTPITSLPNTSAYFAPGSAREVAEHHGAFDLLDGIDPVAFGAQAGDALSVVL